LPRITHLKTIDGALWAKLELDHPTSDGSVHVFTDKEIRELKDRERQAVRDEIEAAYDRWRD